MAVKKCSSVITKSAEIAFQAIHHDDIQRQAPYLQQIYVLCLRGIPLSKTTTSLHDDVIVLLDVTPYLVQSCSFQSFLAHEISL